MSLYNAKVTYLHAANYRTEGCITVDKKFRASSLLFESGSMLAQDASVKRTLGYHGRPKSPKRVSGKNGSSPEGMVSGVSIDSFVYEIIAQQVVVRSQK